MPDDLDVFMAKRAQERQRAAQANTIAATDIAPDFAAQALQREREGGPPALTVMQGNDTAHSPRESYGPIPSNVTRLAQDPAKAAVVSDDHAALGKVGVFAQAWESTKQQLQGFVNPILDTYLSGEGNNLAAVQAALTGHREAWKRLQVDAQRAWSPSLKTQGEAALNTVGDVLDVSSGGFGQAASTLIRPAAKGLSSNVPHAKGTGSFWRDLNPFTPQADLHTLTDEEQEKQWEQVLGVATMLIPLPAGAKALGREPPIAGAPARPAAPVGPEGRFGLTPEGMVADTAGAPVVFTRPKAAADWILREGNTKSSDQLWEIVNGEKQGTWHVQQRGVAEVANEPPHPGTDPTADTMYKEMADADAEGLKVVQDVVAESKLATRDKELMTELLGPDVPGTVYIHPQAIVDARAEGHEVFPDVDVDRALALGRDVEVPTARYVAESAGQPWAEKLNESVRQREYGVSPAEAKELPNAAKESKELTSASATDYEPYIMYHGGTDFNELDFKNLGTGEPGGIRPLGKGLYGTIGRNPEETTQALDLARHYANKYGRAPSTLHAFEVHLPKSIINKLGEPMWHRAGTHKYDNGYWEIERLPAGYLELAVMDAGKLKRIGKWPAGTPDEQILADIEKLKAEVKESGDIEPYDYTPQLEGLEKDEKEEVAAVAPVITQAVARAARNTYLKPLFAEAKTLNLTEPQMALWGKRLQAAVDAANDKLFGKLVAQLKKERTPTFKDELMQNSALVEQEFFNRPDIQAYFYLRYGEHPNGAKLEGNVKLDKKRAVEQYGKERIDALPKEIFATTRDLSPAKEEIEGRPGVNTGRLAKMLGPQLYGDIRDIGAVTVKEVLQNSFDAVSQVLASGSISQGKIDIWTNSDARTIKFVDNGLGMSPELLGGKFLQIAGSEKGENSAGGFGIAKMLFLYGNADLKIVTMKDGVASTMDTSGPKLFEALEEGGEQPKIKVYRKDIPAAILDLFPDGHGTVISLQLPQTYKGKNGEDTEVPFPYGVSRMEALKYSPLFRNIEVKVNNQTIDIGANFPKDLYTQFATIDDPNYTARIYVTREAKEDYGKNVHILSNGLWQFSTNIKKDAGDPWGPNLPYQLYVDIRPKVRPEDGGYPFNFNRQEFIPQVKESFTKILNYIQKVYGSKALADSAASFGEVQYLTLGQGDKAVPSEYIPIKPEIPQTATGFTRGINKGDTVHVTEDGRLLVNGEELPPLSIDDLRKAVPSHKELLVPQSDIRSNDVMLHDNSEFGGKKFTEHYGAEYGQQFYDYMHMVGSTFRSLRNIVAEFPEYSELFDYGIGVSIDPAFRGVSILVPFKGKFVNPFVPESDTSAVEQAYGIIGTMVHELAHFKIRSHNADFPAEMQRLLYRLQASHQFSFAEFQRQFVEKYMDYAGMVKEIKNDFNSHLIGTRGRSFEDGEQQSRSDGGDAGSVGKLGGSSAAGRGRGAADSDNTNAQSPNVAKVFEGRTAGVDADELAEQLGYASGDAMLNDIEKLDVATKAAGLKSPKDYVKRLVKAQALNKTRAELGFDTTPEGIAEAAREALVNVKVTDLLTAELKELAKQAGLPFDKESLGVYADEQFAGMTVKDGLQIRTHERAVAMNGRQAETFLLKNKLPEAFAAKQKQVVNQMLLDRAWEFKRKFEQNMRKLNVWRGAAVNPRIHQTYMDYMHRVIAGMGLKVSRNAGELGRATIDDFMTWVTTELDAGASILYSDPPTVGIAEQTTQQFTNVMDMLRSMEKQGATIKSYYNGVKEEDAEAIRQEVRDKVAAAPPLASWAQTQSQKPKTLGGRVRVEDTPMNFARGIDAALRTMGSIADRMDNGDVNGPFHRMLINPARTMLKTQFDLEQKYYPQLRKLWENIPQEVRDGYNAVLADHPFLEPGSFTMDEDGEIVGGRALELIRGDVPSIILNLGTRSNQDGLVAYGVSADEVVRWLNGFTHKAEWDFARDVGELNQELFPVLEKNKRARTGVGMTEVKRTTIETVHGTYDGWYWPKVADPRFKYFQHSPDIDFEQNPYRVASAPTGFEQPRTRSQYPVFLNLDAVLGTHMNAVFKQLAYGLWLQSANRFIHDPVIRAAVDQSMGHEYTKQLEPWLRDQIFPYNPSLAVQSTWQQVGKHLRRAAQVTWLGFSVKTGISQTAGLIASADMIGETWVARGLRDFAMSIARNGLDEDIFSKSEIMRMRQENPTRDTLEIMEQHKSLTKGSGNFLQAVASGRLLEASDLMARASLHYIGVMDFYGVSGATWLGARAKYISENVGRDGATVEVEAARYADKIVEQSQGTGFAKDMGALERDKNEWARWMTMFNTWPGRFYNLEIDMLRDFAQGRHRAGMHKAVLLFPVNAVLTSLLGFAWPDKKHRKNLAELAKWIGIKTILAPFGGVPIVRDISSGLDQHFTGGGGDMIRGGETYFSRMADNLNKTAALFSPHHKKKDRDIATALQTTGLVTGLIPGAGQIGNTAQGIANLPHAKKDPETITKELIQGRDAKAK